MDSKLENSNLEKPQAENESKNQNSAINTKPKKRGRKKKVPIMDDDNDDIEFIQPNEVKKESTDNKTANSSKVDDKIKNLQLNNGDEDDDDVVIIAKNDFTNTENNNPAPKKRGRKKKVKDDLDFVPTKNESSKPKGKNSSKSKNIENDDDDDDDNDIEIKNGINDLTNLPIELLRMELVQRGYHEGVINRLEKWYLVSMLRETAFNHFNYFSFCSSRFGINSWERNDGPMEKIFENDPETERKRLEEQRLKKEKEREDEENAFDDTSINPDEFSKENIKKSPKRKRMYDFPF